MKDTLKISAQVNAFLAEERSDSNFMVVGELPQTYKIIESKRIVQSEKAQSQGYCPSASDTKTSRGKETMNGKPVFHIDAKNIITLESLFRPKKLCDGPTFSAGSACGFKCTYCYVDSTLRRSSVIANIKRDSGLAFDQIVIRRNDVEARIKDQLLNAKGEPRYSDPSDTRVIYASPLVDPAANMELARETVMICLLILEFTHWQIRLLSKSSLLLKVAEGIPDHYQPRMKYGFSIGTADDDLAKSFEIGTPLVSKRLQALHTLQDRGLPTYGMICPSLPQRDYDAFAGEMAAAIRVDRCEHVWAEVINARGAALSKTCQALRGKSYTWEAEQLEKVASDKEAWEDYSRQTFLAHAKVIPSEKLRFLQYVRPEPATIAWWREREPQGAILLGKHAKASPTIVAVNGSRTEPTKETLAPEEKSMLADCERTIGQRQNAFFELGKALATIRDKKLHREEYKQFGAYCRERWGYDRSYAYRLIQAYEVVNEMSPIGGTPIPSNEAQARLLWKVPAEKRAEVMTKAAALSLGKTITATHIRQAIRGLEEKPAIKTDPATTPPGRKTSHVPLGDFLEWLKVIKDRVRSGQTMEALRLLTRAETTQCISLSLPEEANQTV